MKRQFSFLLFLFLSVHYLNAGSDAFLQRHEKNSSVHVRSTSQQSAVARIEFADTIILQESQLGLIRDNADFSRGLTIDSTSRIETVSDAYQILRRAYSCAARRQIFHLSNSSDGKIDKEATVLF